MAVYIEIPHPDWGLSKLSQPDNILFCCHIKPNIIYHSLITRLLLYSTLVCTINRQDNQHSGTNERIQLN